jgi:hypothetical protein
LLTHSTGGLSETALTQQQDRMRGEVSSLFAEYIHLFKEYPNHPKTCYCYYYVYIFEGIRYFELFLDDFIVVKLGSCSMLGTPDGGKTLLKTVMKAKMAMHHPIDAFICWWRFEDLLSTVMQLVLCNQGVIMEVSFTT